LIFEQALLGLGDHPTEQWTKGEKCATDKVEVLNVSMTPPTRISRAARIGGP
jgi:hypothetical protein